MDATTPQKLDTSGLKKFAQAARRTLMQQVATKLDHVLADGSAARRENPKAVKELEGQVATHGKEQVIERVAYTWFNRFSALRFMDVNGYTPIGVLSPGEGQTRPEILAEAAAGHIDEDVPEGIRQDVAALLDGRRPSRDPQGEAYRLLLVATCNQWHQTMPFLFEKIADYTELLMPEDLLSSDSILSRMRDVMTAEACRDVEIIGWLYQFYISEKKDQVFAGLKKNQKITPENIPAATQLFTPHWIVRYLIDNSLGRLWMQNRPGSKLAAQMDYYIAPEQPEEDFLRVALPEEIRICDPACGSGHMLTYAYDLLYAIYEEEGYDPSEIPAKILTHNLHGIEIDERAGALAAFALVMKAANSRKRFLRRPVQPNVCVLENVSFEATELAEYTAAVGRDLFTADLRDTLGQFAEAKNFGSLIVPTLKDVSEVARVIAKKEFEGNLFLRDVQGRVQAVLRMADYLSAKYHVVVANPPYMGGKGMNGRLADWAKNNYPDSRSDLFSAFIERASNIIIPRGFVAMVTMEAWMFLSSFGKMRENFLTNTTILSMVHMPYLGKGGTPMGINFGTTAFVAKVGQQPDYAAHYSCVRYYETDAQGIPKTFPTQNERLKTVSFKEISKVPGWPIAYWVSPAMRRLFENSPSLSSVLDARQGMSTSDNGRFLRSWWEIAYSGVNFQFEGTGDFITSKKWALYNKAGEFRKWSGNQDTVVFWQGNGRDIGSLKPRSVMRSPEFYFNESISWSELTSSGNSFRYYPKGFVFDTSAHSAFCEDYRVRSQLLIFGNTKLFERMSKIINPTFHFHAGNLLQLPQLTVPADWADHMMSAAVKLSKLDWDAYETSWDFTTLPLLSLDNRQATLAETFARLRSYWRGMTDQMQRLEEENNRVFIDTNGLQDELTPDVPRQEITLTCNPAYRYGGKKTEAELEDLLRADTIREFISYAVGCMFGRYSLDAPGLVLANQGEVFEDYLKRVPEPTFSPDMDNVIPILDGDWFADDIADRFRRFLRVTFGEQRFAENLAFVETALGKDVRRFFLRDFYDDHVRRYKKRPIYWLFSSAKGTFNALIYMHRYRSDTVSTVLEYLREFRRKLDSHRSQLEAVSISSASTQAEKVKALKEIESVSRDIDELDGYERDVLYPLATRRIEIDLDGGVKVNYARFGSALKPIKGLGDVED